MVQVKQVEEVLAGTQCTACGFAGCAPYAQALVAGEAAPNLCQPGGVRVAQKVANLLEVDYLPPAGDKPTLQQVVVREAACIGCTLCIQNCPMDCIIGAPKMAHTVLADLCTGCGLCVPVCPVDCLDFTPHPLSDKWSGLAGLALEKAEKNFAELCHSRAAARTARLQGAQHKKIKGVARTATPKQVEAPTSQTISGENLEKKLPQDILDKIAEAREKSRQRYDAKRRS